MKKKKNMGENEDKIVDNLLKIFVRKNTKEEIIAKKRKLEGLNVILKKKLLIISTTNLLKKIYFFFLR